MPTFGPHRDRLSTWCCCICRSVRYWCILRRLDSEQAALRDRVETVRHSLDRFFILLPPRQITEFISLEGQLGKGAFGTVFRGRATEQGVRTINVLESGRTYAVKRVLKPQKGVIEEISRSLLSNSPQRHVEFIRAVMSSDGSHIVKFVGMFVEVGTAIFQVMEMLAGPDLFDFLDGRSVGVAETDAAGITRQILTAIHYLHRTIGAIHRDIKPENFGFATPVVPGTPLPTLKLFDLGLSWVLPEPVTEATASSLLKLKRAGTAMYMAPEGWDGLAGAPSDVWGAGLIAYVLLSLQLPFALLSRRGRGDPARAVREAPLAFAGRAWAGISEPPRQLLRALLDKDPHSRMTTGAALADPWLAGAACCPEAAAAAAPAARELEPLALPARSAGGEGESQIVWQSMLSGAERFLSASNSPLHAAQM